MKIQVINGFLTQLLTLLIDSVSRERILISLTTAKLTVLFFLFIMPESGKIQYIQDKQGFIRCHKKVNGKRDIIFFKDDINSRLRSQLKQGMVVEFDVCTNGHKINIRGGTVTHWAVIRRIVFQNEERSSTEPVTKNSSITFNDSDDTSTLSSDSHFTGIPDEDHTSLYTSKSYDTSIQNMSEPYMLISEVYSSLYKKKLPTVTYNQLGNCWQLFC